MAGTRQVPRTGEIAPEDGPALGRILAPDLARGAMLLLIALANVPIYLTGHGQSTVGAHPLGGSVADRIVQALTLVSVDQRVYPMFAVLVGYGITMSDRAARAKGVTVRASSQRLCLRNLALIGFGGAHAALLWGGDILGVYGLFGLLLVLLFLRRSDVVVVAAIGVGAVILFLFAVCSLALGVTTLDAPGHSGSGAGSGSLGESVATGDALAAVGLRLTAWAELSFTQGLLSLAVPVAMLLGLFAARHRILEEPHRHARAVRAVAVVGVLTGWAGGLPIALVHVGALPDLQGLTWALSAPHSVTGLACGVGYVATFALLGDRLQNRPRGRFTTGVTAVGKRSLSCYLAQSLICAPILAGWGLGLATKLGSTTAAIYALGAWLLTFAWAAWLERHGRPGPAESLLRRLSYPRPRS